MIHLVTHKNRRLYEREMRDFHSERRQQFIVERGWRLAERDGGEFDDYDDDQALYLLGFSPDGGLEVGCRLRPTVDGGVLPDVFPHLIADHEPSLHTQGVYECTRYFSTARARGRRGFEARSRLHIAMQECVRDRSGHRLLGFVDLPLLTHLRRYSGLRIRPVGLPAAYGEDGVTVAFEIGVTTEDLQDTRRRLEIPTRQLFEAPEWTPTGTPVIALAQALAVLTEGEEDERARFSEAARLASERIVHHPDVDGLMTRLLARAA